jgi:uncharacterized protein YecT (DUF1311 family)
MNGKLTTALLAGLLLSLLVLAACQATAPAPQIVTVRETVMVRETVAVRETVTVLETVPVEVTRLATVVVAAPPVASPTPRPTITPAPGQTPPSYTCAMTATTQSAINQCTAMEADEARARLLLAISRNRNLTENPEFALIQQQWEQQTERECALLLLKTTDGVYYYGTMAPMLYYSCITRRIHSRYDDLQRSACGAERCDAADGFPDWPAP